MEIRKFHSFTQKLLENLEKVIRGKEECLEYLITGLIAGGHILIEDVPGLGKTTLAKTLAHLISRTKKGLFHQGWSILMRRSQNYISGTCILSVSRITKMPALI